MNSVQTISLLTLLQAFEELLDANGLIPRGFNTERRVFYSSMSAHMEVSAPDGTLSFKLGLRQIPLSEDKASLEFELSDKESQRLKRGTVLLDLDAVSMSRVADQLFSLLLTDLESLLTNSRHLNDR